MDTFQSRSYRDSVTGGSPVAQTRDRLQRVSSPLAFVELTAGRQHLRGATIPPGACLPPSQAAVRKVCGARRRFFRSAGPVSPRERGEGGGRCVGGAQRAAGSRGGTGARVGATGALPRTGRAPSPRAPPTSTPSAPAQSSTPERPTPRQSQGRPPSRPPPRQPPSEPPPWTRWRRCVTALLCGTPLSPRGGVGDRRSSLPRASPVAAAVVPSPGWARATEPHRRARARERVTRRGWRPVMVVGGDERVASWHGERVWSDEGGGGGVSV